MAIEIRVQKDKKLGVWQGMGGAISEATAYSFYKLSPEKQQEFLKIIPCMPAASARSTLT